MKTCKNCNNQNRNEAVYCSVCEAKFEAIATQLISEKAVDDSKCSLREMVFVKGGTFMMGGADDTDCFRDEMPAHPVILSDFYIGKYAVTQKEWKAVMGVNPSLYKGKNLPAGNISWDDIVGQYGDSKVINGVTYYSDGFIYKLNRMTGKQFRLPTEAEWEYAARGGVSSKGYKYSGSNSVGDVAWYMGNSDRKQHNAGGKQPNELGIYDMSGNVWEWCADTYCVYSSEAQTNPVCAANSPYITVSVGLGARETLSGSLRVCRGGSCISDAVAARVSFRNRNERDIRYENLGFRLASGS
jgi:formylglycine-generating enzyme required for sulfatase activity